ncbi:MAG TPA: hypothetical protein VK970_05670 [Candidatus Methylacidiphilales bacterium]|nr:hypothetical protein [Candidatus Methylacidiphilales bacterium]
MKTFFWVVAVVMGMSIHAWAVDFCGGQVSAVPVKNGKAPVIDGDLKDWDLSAQEPVYISEQTARTMNGDWAFMYDDDAFYIAAKVSMPGRPYSNVNNPQDAFWSGDILQVRMSSDPAAKYPLDRERDAANPRIVHLSFWKNTETQENFLHIADGPKLNLGKRVNPEGSKVVLDTVGDEGYTLEARIPWSALNVPGGKNPFKPGDKTALIAETIYIGGDTSRVPLCYNRNPGTFAFNQTGSWGQVEFAAKGLGERRRPTLEALYAKMSPASKSNLPTVGVPIEFEVPGDSDGEAGDGRKVSLNIFGPKGEVLRELLGAEILGKGKQTVRWDGRDAWGRPLPPGTYKWGAYMHGGLKAEYAGSVGTSGVPAWQTRDGKGAWGGDHSNPIAAASDASGIYMLWPVSEAGKAIVKVDYDGRVLWRKNPFVGGGFGPFYSLASDGKYLYLARGDAEVFLSRLEAETGALRTWTEGGPAEVQISTTEAPALVPRLSTPVTFSPVKTSFITPKVYPGSDADSTLVHQPDPVGMAYAPTGDGEGRLYVSIYSADKVLVLDIKTGKVTSELKVRGPRGLAVNGTGDLFAVSYVPGLQGIAEVLRFEKGAGAGTPVISEKGALDAPFGIAVDSRYLLSAEDIKKHKEGAKEKDGFSALMNREDRADQKHIYVSNLGATQQVKIFTFDGKEAGAIGRKGGRPWQGKYDPEALLMPAGLAIDARGALVVPEAALPKVFSRFDLAAGNKLIKRWFGPGVYWNSTWPMPEDPLHVFYMNTHGIGRGKVAGVNEPGLPDAYWETTMSGFTQIPDLESGIPQPEAVRAINGSLYLVRDVREHAIMLLGEDDKIRPVATFTPVGAKAKDNLLKINHLKIWVDLNGDGLVTPDEQSILSELSDGKPMPNVATTTSSMHMEPNGDLYFSTHDNCILLVPAVARDAFQKDGSVRWDTTKARLVVPTVLPGLKEMSTTYRQGILGVRRDEFGNIYTLFNTRVDGKSGGEFDYPTPEIATRMREGMGHTSSFNVIKVAKYDGDGSLIWMAGRKATAGARPGEMYHHWNMAGLVNERYVAAGSEWGQIYFYTSDGFFVDALMNNPGDVTQPGPYTFGGETSGGRVTYFPKLGELWAYSSGMSYRVRGFSKGEVERETRLTGEVVLDKKYDVTGDGVGSGPAKEPAKPLEIVALQSEALTADANAWTEDKTWAKVPVSTLTRNGKDLAKAQIAYDAEFLYARLVVTDESPLQNGATEPQLAFKGGDTAGIVLGPVRGSGSDAEKDKAERTRPGKGDIRLMAAFLNGKARLIAMKGVVPDGASHGKKPFEYFTPAAGKVAFEFVDDVPGAKVDLVKTGNDTAGQSGYVATFAVPRAFLDFELKPGVTLRGDIEVRLSGDGGRGLQATSRNYLFTPGTSETTMTDDVPTESRLFPQHWGEALVK